VATVPVARRHWSIVSLIFVLGARLDATSLAMKRLLDRNPENLLLLRAQQ
jgi:hypothetical protein